MNMKYDVLFFSPVPPGLGDRNPRRTRHSGDDTKRDETVQFMWCVDVYYTRRGESALTQVSAKSVSQCYTPPGTEDGPHAHPRALRTVGGSREGRHEVLTVFASHARPSASAAELAAIQACPNCMLARL